MTRHCSGTLAERKRSAILVWQCASRVYPAPGSPGPQSRSHPRGQHNGQCVIRSITTGPRLWPGPNPYFQLKMMAGRRVTNFPGQMLRFVKPSSRGDGWENLILHLPKHFHIIVFTFTLWHRCDMEVLQENAESSLKMNLYISNSFRINFEPNKKLILQIRAKRLNIKDPERPEAVSLVRFPLLCTNRNCITGILRTCYKRQRELNRKR